MQGVQTITRRQSRLSAYRIAVTLVGLIALLLTITDALPALTTIGSVIYCVGAPAWVLRRHTLTYLPHVRPVVATLVLMPAVLVAWVVILSLLWLGGQSLTDEQVTIVLAVTIVVMTELLLWDAPAFYAFDLRSLRASYLASVLLFIGGAVLGTIVAMIVNLL